MVHDQIEFDARALPRGFTYAGVFFSAVVVGVLLFGAYASTLTA